MASTNMKENTKSRPRIWRSTPDTEEVRRQLDELRAVIREGAPLYMVHFQTTGFEPQEESIVQAAAIRYEKVDGSYKETGRFAQWVNPKRPLPRVVLEGAGLTEKFLSNYPGEAVVMRKMAAFLGENPVIVSHNADFATGFLTTAAARAGITVNIRAAVSLTGIARGCMFFPDPEMRYTYKNVAEVLHVPYAPARDAEADAVGYGKVFLKLMKMYPSGRKAARVMSMKVVPGGSMNWRLAVKTDLGVLLYDPGLGFWVEGQKGVFSRIDMEKLEKMFLSVSKERTMYLTASRVKERTKGAA